MALNARKVKNTSGPKAPAIDEGAYPARLVQVIDLGLQKQEYAGETKAPKNDIWTTYELGDEFMPDEDGNPDEDRPRWLSERLPLNSLDSDLAKSTKRYYALDPNEEEEGDWTKLIGRPVLVTVTRKKREDGDRNYIGGTTAPRPKDAAKYNPLVNDPVIFSMDDPDVEVFNNLPDFLKDIIKGGLEYEGSKLAQLLDGGENKPPKGKSKNPAPDVESGVDETASLSEEEEEELISGNDSDNGEDW